MSHYRKIDVRIWNDAKFSSLPTTGKLGFFLMLTHPSMTALGAMRGTPAGLVAELEGFRDGFAEGNGEGFRDGFAEVFAKGMAEFDQTGRLIALPNFVKYNPPTAPNVVKSWVNALEYLPECELKAVVVQRAVAFAEGMGKGFREAIPQALRDAMRYPLNIEHRAYPIQGGKVSELATTGGRGARLAVVNGEDEL